MQEVFLAWVHYIFTFDMSVYSDTILSSSKDSHVCLC